MTPNQLTELWAASRPGQLAKPDDFQPHSLSYLVTSMFAAGHGASVIVASVAQRWLAANGARQEKLFLLLWDRDAPPTLDETFTQGRFILAVPLPDARATATAIGSAFGMLSAL